MDFLKDTGEMGELVQNYPWETTSLGHPSGWPFSLRVALGNLLPSKFPMFLFWGPELLCFYNDAYRPSLGNNGKHPSALGKRGVEVFPEIWDSIKPLIDDVLAGGDAILNEDLLLPIYRNNALEDVYWTFCYSRAMGDDGSIAGVLVICQETTKQVQSLATIESNNLQLKEALAAEQSAIRTTEISERRFRALVQAAPIAMALFTGPEFIIEEPNQAFINIAGKGNHIEGKPLREVMPELEGQPFFGLIDEVFATGKKYEAKGIPAMVIHNGVEMNNIYDVSYIPLFNERNEVYSILETAVDVTHQELAKRGVQKSEADLRNLILQAPVAMSLLMGKNYVVQIANEKMFELWGRSGDLLLDKPIFEGLPEAKGQGFEDLLDNVYQTGIPFKGNEVPIMLPRNGHLEQIFVNFVYDAFRNVEGEVSGIMVVGTEVTEQVNARKTIEKNQLELQLTTNRLQLAIEAGELGLYELEYANDNLVSSDRFKEIFEIPPSGNHRESLASVHPDDMHIRIEAHKNSLQTGVLNYNVRLLFPANRTKWVKVKGLVTFDGNGKPLTLLGVVQDITESKELEFQKDSFLGIASHELKTPVTSIKAFTQVMQSIFEASGETKYASMMEKIDKQVNKLTYLISDLLDVTKINSGRLQFNTSSFNFDEMVAEVAQDIQTISPRHRLILDLRFQEKITADKDRLMQVIINLINNAIKYSPDAREVSISTERQDHDVILRVKDYGIGIAEEKQAMIFEQFYRVSGNKEHTFPGLGLGLFISSNTITRMGGRIWVNSVEGKGSTFCFSLPLKD